MKSESNVRQAGIRWFWDNDSGGGEAEGERKPVNFLSWSSRGSAAAISRESDGKEDFGLQNFGDNKRIAESGGNQGNASETSVDWHPEY
jgi:hypothetical protein